jgi:hypothetical protein
VLAAAVHSYRGWACGGDDAAHERRLPHAEERAAKRMQGQLRSLENPSSSGPQEHGRTISLIAHSSRPQNRAFHGGDDLTRVLPDQQRKAAATRLRGSRLAALALRPEPRPKPEGHQRALAREAMSLGEQSSDLQGQLSV